MMHRLLHLNTARFVAFFPALVISAVMFGGCAGIGGSYSSRDRTGLLETAPGAYQSPNAKTLYAMSRILMSQGREDQGELVLLGLIMEYPRFSPAYCDLAELRMLQGRLDDAIQELSRGLQVAPQDPFLLNNLGVCSLLKGDFDRALGNFTMAAELMPSKRRYRANMALALGMMGSDEESLSLYMQLLPDELAQHNLNIIAEIRKDFEQALQERIPEAPAAAGPVEAEELETSQIETEPIIFSAGPSLSDKGNLSWGWRKQPLTTD